MFPSLAESNPTASRGALGADATLGRYKIIEELGRGQMGVVYRGRDPKIDRDVAIKTIQLDAVAHGLDHKTLLQRFTLEAQTAGRLSHANIATIYDVGEENGVTFFAMEYVEGHTLEDYLRENPVPRFDETLDLLAQVAAGIDAAHEEGVIHRDIKPANILIRADGQVKITDFGIARFSTTELTQTGTTLGTPSYMSPEQLSGEELDGRTDLYALGVIAFRMLTGEKPFRSEEVATLICKIMNGDMADPLRINPLLPQPCRKVLSKALERNRNKRYESGKELVSALKKVLLDPVEMRRLMELTRRQQPSGWWQRWSPWIAGGLGVIAIASIGASLMKHDDLQVVAFEEFEGQSMDDHKKQTLQHLARGEALISEGRRQEAMAEFDAAWQISPDTVRLRKAAYVQLLLRVAEDTAARDPAAASRYYSRILALSPEYIVVYYQLGELHAQQGEWEAAKDDFLEVLRRDPTHVEARFNYGKILARLGAYDEALGELWEVIERKPPFLADARAWRGLCWERLGEIHKAEVNYRKSLELDSSNQLARKRMEALGG
jgi:serine/threonine protein kinase/Flp pilus assembly protein TadD